jgi:hypothetical protein
MFFIGSPSKKCFDSKELLLSGNTQGAMKPESSDFCGAAGLQVYTRQNRQHLYSMFIYCKVKKIMDNPRRTCSIIKWFIDIGKQYE